MMVKLTKMTTFVFAGAAGAAIAFSPIAGAEPAPPPCWNPDGTPCASIGTAGPDGANVAIPGGPVGSAGPGGASGCIPGIGCATIPAP